MMRRGLVILALLLASVGCSTQTNNEVLIISKLQQLQEITFESGSGRAILILDEDIVDCIIYAQGLNPDERYTVTLVGDHGVSPGVTFGPLENVQLRIGSLEDEVMFKPNTEGELFVSMLNPIHFFTAAKKELLFKIESESGKVIMITSPFLVNP